MLKNKTAAYCVLLSMLVSAGTVFGSVGETQARYNNTVFCSTVIETAKTEISSDLLTKKTEAPVTVLLGEISGEKTVLFRVESSAGETKEKISWNVSSEYVSAELRIGETAVESGSEITISEDTEIAMRIIPSEQVNENTTAKIDVSVGELSGTFEAYIPETEEPEQETPGSTDIPSDTGGNESSSEGSSTTLNNGSGEASGEESAEVVESPGAGLKALGHFEPKGKLPVKMNLPNGITSVKIGFYENGVFAPLPEGTKISIDEGNKFYTVYGGGIAEFDIGKISINSSGYSVLLDFEKAEIGEAETVTVAAETYSGENKTGFYTVSAVPDISGAGKTRIDSGIEEIETDGEESSAEDAGYYILTAENSLLTIFPKEWIEEEEAALEYSVRILSLDGNKSPVYVDADLYENSLWAYYTVDETNCRQKIEIRDILPNAGTYQADLSWKFGGVCFFEKQITFFIDYSTDIYSTLES